MAKGSTPSRTRWYVLAGVVVVLIGVVAAYVATRGDNNTVEKASVAATTVPAGQGAICPLTGAPAPAGVVPARPALGVKIGNYPGDRPSAGLNQADIVFEEPVEGAITRLLAVFQCRGASLVGDVRSARQPDVGILSQLSNPLLVHAGGIAPVLALLASAPLTDDNLYTGDRGSAIIQKPGRVAPYATFVNTASLWAFNPSDTKPPAPIFQYSPALPAGSVTGSGASVHIPFSSSSDVTWKWNPSAGYQRYYSGSPDILLDGTQTTAANVVIMTVQTSNGPWVENSEGGLEVQVNATGSGPLLVMRNDTAIAGTWSRSGLTQPATLTTSHGAPIPLQPGNTWVELVPSGIPVTPSGAVAGRRQPQLRHGREAQREGQRGRRFRSRSPSGVSHPPAILLHGHDRPTGRADADRPDADRPDADRPEQVAGPVRPSRRRRHCARRHRSGVLLDRGRSGCAAAGDPTRAEGSGLQDCAGRPLGPGESLHPHRAPLPGRVPGRDDRGLRRRGTGPDPPGAGPGRSARVGRVVHGREALPPAGLPSVRRGEGQPGQGVRVGRQCRVRLRGHLVGEVSTGQGRGTLEGG